MTHDELITRLERAAVRELPDPAALLERAFPAGSHSDARTLAFPAATAASAVLALATSTPLWLEPAEIDRERTATLVAAARETARLWSQEWNQLRDEHE